MESTKNSLMRLLRKSERIFNTDMVYVAKGGFWLTFLQVVSSLSSFILAVGFARFLSKDAYGTYKYIMSVGGVLAAFSLTGLSTVVTNAAARNQDGTLGFAFRKNLAWGSLTFALFIASAGYYFLHGNALLASGLVIIGAATPLLGSASLSDSFFVGKKDFKRSAITSGAAILITNLSTLIAAFVTHSILVIIAAYVVSSLIVELLIYIYAVRLYKPHEKEVDPDALSYGAHLSFLGIFNILVDRLDSIFAFHFLGSAELAVYAFAIAIPEQFKGFLKNASSLALPKFSQNNIAETYRTMHRKMWIMTLLIGSIIAIYAVVAGPIFRILFPQYLGPAVSLSRLYMLTLLPSAAVLPSTLLQAMAAKRELYLFNIISGIAQVIFMSVGTIVYGLWGLVAAFGLSRLFRFVYVYALTHHLVKKLPSSASPLGQAE